MVLYYESSAMFPARHSTPNAYNLGHFGYTTSQQAQYGHDFGQFQVSPIGANDNHQQSVSSSWHSPSVYEFRPPGTVDDWSQTNINTSTIPSSGLTPNSNSQNLNAYTYRSSVTNNTDYVESILHSANGGTPSTTGSSTPGLENNATPGICGAGIDGMPRNSRHPYEWMKKQAYQNQPAPGKTRTKDKYRVVYSDHQRLELEKEFHYSRYITIRRKSELAQALNLSERQVKIWFQNRRAKERKQSKRKDDVTKIKQE
uniref:Transcription factor Homeobox protein n=2 Tax=Peripatopsidae TaxID=27567 RepID=A0A0E4C368_9BILA|nr:transcription factor Homeobox gene [Euperipatoides kanangrensis]